MPKPIKYPRSTRGNGVAVFPHATRLEVAFLHALRELKELHRDAYGYAPSDATIFQAAALGYDKTLKKLYDAHKGEEKTNVTNQRPSTSPRGNRQYLDGVKATRPRS